MKYKTLDNGIFIEKNREFDLQQTLECGQCFRFTTKDGKTYTGTAMGKSLTVTEDDSGIFFHNTSEEEFKSVWYDYFDLALDYSDVKRELVQSYSGLSDVIEYSPGIRILKQDPWEALCSFIISQNNNIPRIMGIVDRLCTLCGELNADGSYNFPTADVLANMSIDNLAPIRSGFRAKYLIDAAQKVSMGVVDLDRVANEDIEEARKELMLITGVGPKVAECTLLYGMHRLEAFPIDVWMKRAMSTLFNGVDPQSFGKYAGIAQQYIFHYARQSGKV